VHGGGEGAGSHFGSDESGLIWYVSEAEEKN